MGCGGAKKMLNMVHLACGCVPKSEIDNLKNCWHKNCWPKLIIWVAEWKDGLHLSSAVRFGGPEEIVKATKYFLKNNKLFLSDRYSVRVTKRLIRVFIHDYLRPDGVFLLRLIAINTNCLIASEIIANLWDEFKDDEKIVKKAEHYNHKER